MSRLHECVGDSVFYWKDIGDVIFSICVTPWSKLYRADLIKKCRKDYSGGLIYHDNILFFKMLFNSKRAYFNDKFLFTHRIYSSSTVHAHNERSVDIIRTYNLIVKTFMDYGHFEEFKEGLYNRKVSACNYRYDLINDEFKEFFFSEMKKDFEKIIGNEKYDEFYSSLYSFNRSAVSCVLNAAAVPSELNISMFSCLMNSPDASTVFFKLKSPLDMASFSHFFVYPLPLKTILP